MDPVASSEAAEPSSGRGTLTARMFSIDGKMTVTLLGLCGDLVIATTNAPPPPGSIAVVTRNSVRVPATIASADGRRFTLTLDEPLDGRRREQFVRKSKIGREASVIQAVAA